MADRRRRRDPAGASALASNTRPASGANAEHGEVVAGNVSTARMLELSDVPSMRASIRSDRPEANTPLKTLFWSRTSRYSGYERTSVRGDHATGR